MGWWESMLGASRRYAHSFYGKTRQNHHSLFDFSNFLGPRSARRNSVYSELLMLMKVPGTVEPIPIFCGFLSLPAFSTNHYQSTCHQEILSLYTLDDFSGRWMLLTNNHLLPLECRFILWLIPRISSDSQRWKRLGRFSAFAPPLPKFSSASFHASISPVSIFPDQSTMSFLAGCTGCCIGLLTKLYSNALRKLPYMRGMLFAGGWFVSHPSCRALGARPLHDRRWILLLLRKEVYCRGFWCSWVVTV